MHKLALSFGATKKVLNFAKENNIELFRNSGKNRFYKFLFGGKGSEVNIPLDLNVKGGLLLVDKQDNLKGLLHKFAPPIEKLLYKQPLHPRNTFLHELGHRLDDSTTTFLGHERAANSKALDLIKKFESPEFLEKSLQDYKNAFRIPYHSYKEKFILTFLDKGKGHTLNRIFGKKPTISEIKQVYKDHPELMKKHWEP